MMVDRTNGLEFGLRSRVEESVPAGTSRERLGQYRVREQGCGLRIDGPSGAALPHMYQKGCRSLSHRAEHILRVFKGLTLSSSKATYTAANHTPDSDQAAPVDGPKGWLRPMSHFAQPFHSASSGCASRRCNRRPSADHRASCCFPNPRLPPLSWLRRWWPLLRQI